MSIDTFGIHLSPLYMRFYGLILMAGALAGAYLAAREAQPKGPAMFSCFIWFSIQSFALVWSGSGSPVVAWETLTLTKRYRSSLSLLLVCGWSFAIARQAINL